MIPELHVLPGAIAWIVHPAAGFAIVNLAAVLFSRQGEQPLVVLRAALIIMVLSAVGANWVVHPAAGMLLGYFGTRAFHRWREHVPALLAALAASAVFIVQGAGWMGFYLMIMGMVWLFTSSWRYSGQRQGGFSSGTEVWALQEQAGGLPMFPAASQWAGPVMPAAYVPSRRDLLERAEEVDPFTALQLDSRLPGDVRAQLVALDLRTCEALTQLRGLGQDGSEEGYLARAIREEYAPGSVLAYLKLPRSQADVTPIEDGKTGHDLLRGQLDILLEAVQDILNSTLRAGGQELLTNQRFLEDKFRKSKTELEV